MKPPRKRKIIGWAKASAASLKGIIPVNGIITNKDKDATGKATASVIHRYATQIVMAIADI